MAQCTMEFVERVLERWGNCCVISGRTSLKELVIVPYRGFSDNVPVPDREWVVISTDQNRKLTKLSSVEARLVKFPEMVRNAIFDNEA